MQVQDKEIKENEKVIKQIMEFMCLQERLRRETKGYTLGGEADDEDDQKDVEDLNKLTSEGKVKYYYYS